MTQNAEPSRNADQAVADAMPANWVDRWAPRAARPYLRLMRADRPIGSWLLMWPCWWSAALATQATGTLQDGRPLGTFPDPWFLLLFALGAIVMRGAGCTYNDFVDRDIDGSVARTRSRPIPSGAVSPKAAFTFAVLLSLIGFLVLIQFNAFTIGLGIASLGIIAVYPFMKRITYWPQIVLGLAMNWGALMGWAAVTGSHALAPVVLFAGAIAWTIGYDTIYAHQDREDDALLGLKSTALKFGARTKPWLWLFYSITALSFIGAGLLAGLGVGFYLVIGFAIWHLFRQITRLDIDNGARCLALFRSNRDLGIIVFIAIIAGSLGPPLL